MHMKNPTAKQAINDKLQGRVAAYFRSGGVVNNQIKKGLSHMHVPQTQFRDGSRHRLGPSLRFGL